MKTTPLKGMKDILPREQRIRDYVQGEILKTYRAAGFERISTPIMEDMENLDKSDGGDNLNLIFKVLKRGDKLEKALASGSEKELSDMGLRYDLTLPLSRYYAANREQRPAPFKVIQTDRVYRAERPQKGRLREFVQCDIDILGDESHAFWRWMPLTEGGILPGRWWISCWRRWRLGRTSSSPPTGRAIPTESPPVPSTSAWAFLRAI